MLRNAARALVAIGTLTALALTSGAASAGTECEGAGLFNNVFPGPVYYGGEYATVSVQIVDLNPYHGWTAYLDASLNYNGSAGTAASASNVLVAFSDRFAPAPGTFGGSNQRFYAGNQDSWNLTVDETGTVSIHNDTWGGDLTIHGTCYGTGGVILAVSGTDHLLVGFGKPAINIIPR